MTTPVSLWMWISLIVTIGVPMHLAVNRGIAHWRRNYEISSVLTITLVMLVSLILMPLLHGAVIGLEDVTKLALFSGLSGLAFGIPMGLIFRVIARPAPSVQGDWQCDIEDGRINA